MAVEGAHPTLDATGPTLRRVGPTRLSGRSVVWHLFTASVAVVAVSVSTPGLRSELAYAASPQDVEVKLQPAAGFVVADTNASTERLRVEASGAVYLPGLLALVGPSSSLCSTATGQVGACPLPTIVQTCNTMMAPCAASNDCPFDAVVNATCPPGYTRGALISCRVPDSPNLAAEPFVDPYDNTVLGCRYFGAVQAGTPDILVTSIWCILAPANPCLTP